MKVLGGRDEDVVLGAVESADSGLVIAGRSQGSSPIRFGALLVKFDRAGNCEWMRKLGGAKDDIAYNLVQTADSGLVITGTTQSYGVGNGDVLLTKFNPAGDHLWTRTLGGAEYDGGYSLVQSSDGALVVAGWTKSFGSGAPDVLLSKLDAKGGHLWTRILGGVRGDYALSLIQTTDKGFVVTGYTQSYGAGSSDVLLCKFDSNGNHVWTRVFGGPGWDQGRWVIQTIDGGIAVTGETDSFGPGDKDMFLSKFDAKGNHLWTRTLGVKDDDSGYSLVQARDGTILVTGWTGVSGGGYVGDVLFSKFDNEGQHIRTQTLGGPGWDKGLCIIQTSDGGFVVGGGSTSYGGGDPDVLLVKFDSSGNGCTGSPQVPASKYVNPTITVPRPMTQFHTPGLKSPVPAIVAPLRTTKTVCQGNESGRK
ncbi:MAG: hypothetical protein QME66_11745 [Candidatus Eisenbacteria bacterium]|nr:hypothetical protein [Candidatus Eisenbacteria bacterium]